MSIANQLLFRADHVGSFLRPKYPLDAREQFKLGQLSAAQLRSAENQASSEVIKLQEAVGLRGITDGEFRRTYFHIDFLEQLGDVQTDAPVTIIQRDGSEELASPTMRIIDKVRHVKDIQRADFEYLKSHTTRTLKVSIPSSTMLHFCGGRAGISKRHDPEVVTIQTSCRIAMRHSSTA